MQTEKEDEARMQRDIIALHQACARHVHVHGMCMACAWHVHGMCMACAAGVASAIYPPQASVVAAQLMRRQSYWLGGACRMVAIRLRRHQLGDAVGVMPPPPPPMELSAAVLGSHSYLGQRLMAEARLAHPSPSSNP